ncbi:MAG: DUF1343 domain-containing protein, partial [Bacteroidales bacterium]|nr:DUF1343 domain-containing protein [Bacteroidales bacterium]
MKNVCLLSAFIVFFLYLSACCNNPKPVITGAEQIESYLPLLQQKRVGILTNHTALIGKTHLVDSLLSLGVNIHTIF